MVPGFQLSENGHALVIERFDLKADGSYRGFEDFCVLNGLTSAKKYDGGYETRLFKRASEFIEVEGRRTALERLFRLFVLNCALRNGDAHLKNFGIIYDDVVGPARLAPVYDLVTTDAYIPDDPMALTLNGSTLWPDKRALVVLAQSRCDIATKEIGQILEQTADALCDVMADVKRYFSEVAAHPEIGDRMLNAWETGIAMSLERSDHRMLLLSGAPCRQEAVPKAKAPPEGGAKALIRYDRPLLHELDHLAVLVLALRAVLADVLEQRRVRHRVEDGVARAGVDVPAPDEVRHHHDVVRLPVEGLAADLGLALAVDHHDEGAAGLALGQRLLAGAQELRLVVQRREHRLAGHRIDELHLDAFVRVALLLAQPLERRADLVAADSG